MTVGRRSWDGRMRSVVDAKHLMDERFRQGRRFWRLTLDCGHKKDSQYRGNVGGSGLVICDECEVKS